MLQLNLTRKKMKINILELPTMLMSIPVEKKRIYIVILFVVFFDLYLQYQIKVKKIKKTVKIITYATKAMIENATSASLSVTAILKSSA